MSSVQRVYDESGHPVACNVGQLGPQFGDGVFETLLVSQGRLPFWDLHFSRLRHGLDTLHIKVETRAITRSLESILAHALPTTSYRLRLQVLRAQPANYLGYRCTKSKPLIVIGLFPLDVSSDELQTSDGIDVAFLSGQLSSQPMLAGLKHCNRLEQVLFKQQQETVSGEWSASIAEGLISNQQDNLVEAVAANVFLKVDGCWLTPEITSSGVAGVTRQFVLDSLAVNADIKITVTPVASEQAATASAMFLTSAVKGIVLVNNIWMSAERVIALAKDPEALKFQAAWQLAAQERHIDLTGDNFANIAERDR